MPSLEHLMFSAPKGFEDMFSNSVSRMDKLKIINSMAITAASRRGAEYDLWKVHAVEWTKGDDSERAVLSKRCRAYPRLVKSKSYKLINL